MVNSCWKSYFSIVQCNKEMEKLEYHGKNCVIRVNNNKKVSLNIYNS